MKTGITYRRLPGWAGLIFRKRLYLGPGHVLYVTSNVVTQQYRRFYFADIQSFVIAEFENPARFYGAVLSIITGVLTIALVYARRPIFAALFAVACAALSAFTLTRSSVRCILRTRVSAQPLPCLRTLPTALAFANILKTEVVRVQGALPAQALASYPHAPYATVPPPLRPYSGAMHYAAFAAMFAVALLTPIRLSERSGAFASAFASIHIGLIVLAITAAVKQHGTAIARAARIAIAVALAWAAVSYVTEQIIVASTITEAFHNPMKFDYWRDPVRDVAIANAIAYATFGMIGVLAMLSQRRPAPAT